MGWKRGRKVGGSGRREKKKGEGGERNTNEAPSGTNEVDEDADAGCVVVMAIYGVGNQDRGDDLSRN